MCIRGLRNKLRTSVLIIASALLSYLASAQATKSQASTNAPGPQAFIERAEKRLYDLSVTASRASWVQSTYITDDTEQISAEAQDEYTAAVTELATEARKYERMRLPALITRKLMLLKLALSAPAPSNPREREE